MYHAREFTSEKQNYWSQDQQGHSEWQGKLAEKWDLRGSVGNEQFARLTEGQHPQTGEQLVRHQPEKTYENQIGREVTSVEHRSFGQRTFCFDGGTEERQVSQRPARARGIVRLPDWAGKATPQR